MVKKVISLKNLPSRLPIFPIMTMYLFLDKVGVAQWVWGSVGLLFALIWAVAIYGICTEDRTELKELK